MAQISIIKVQDITIENGPTNVQFDYTEAKTLLATMLAQTQPSNMWHTRRWYKDRIVMATIPALPGTNPRNCNYTDSVQCIANGGEHYINGRQVGFFSPFLIDTESYLYKAQNGDWMLAVSPEDIEAPMEYYRVYKHEY